MKRASSHCIDVVDHKRKMDTITFSEYLSIRVRLDRDSVICQDRYPIAEDNNKPTQDGRVSAMPTIKCVQCSGSQATEEKSVAEKYIMFFDKTALINV